MIIRKILNEEMNEALNLIWNVFLKFEAHDYSEEGIKEFRRTIDDSFWIETREFFGAYSNDNELLGVIATKDESHISLFFVDEKYQGQGIGRKLFEKVKSLNTKNYFTVNSSPYAHEIYKHLGFVDTDKKQLINGIIFYPMRLDF